MPPCIIQPLILLACFMAASAAEVEIYREGVEGFASTWASSATREFSDDAAQGGKVMRIVVEKATEQLWNAQTFVTPLAADIAKDARVSVKFRARCLQPGKGRLTVQLGLAKDPYTPLLDKTFEIGQEWAAYSISAAAAEPLAAQDGRFGFMYGHQAQTLEISALQVTSGGAK